MLTSALALEIHQDNVNAGWWTDLETGLPKKRCHTEMKLLQITELAEAMEGYRKDRMDDKLPQYKMLHVELVDCMIRQLDLIGYLMSVNLSFYLEDPKADLGSIHYPDSVPKALMGLIASVIQSDRSEGYELKDHAFIDCVSALRDVYGYALTLGFDIKEVMDAKRAFNKTREDHKIANRMAEGGKKC